MLSGDVSISKFIYKIPCIGPSQNLIDVSQKSILINTVYFITIL